MTDASRTTQTESATHFTVTIVKPKTEQGQKAESIRQIVKRYFEAGSTYGELVAAITKAHPTSAAAKSPKKHIGWYKAKMQGEWVMIGPWAPKASANAEATETVVQTTIEQNAARIAELEALLAAAKAAAIAPAEAVIEAAPEETLEEKQARMLAEVEARLAELDDKDEDEAFEVEAVDAA